MSHDRASADAPALARWLVEREMDGDLEPGAVGVAMQRAAGRIVDDLTRAVGADGLHALLDRAIARATAEHPVVSSMRRVDNASTPLDVTPVIEAHGADAARAGLEAVLAALIDILTALIGADMVRNLLHAVDS
jgi:hypothetical protein